MFRTRRTKITSTPVEEVLEVKEPVFEPLWEQDWPEEDPWEESWIEEEPEYQQQTNIESLIIDRYENEMQWGKLVDYDGNYYYFQWDNKSKRIVRLVGSKINKLTWDLCNEVLQKYYVKQQEPKTEDKILPQVEKVISGALNQINASFKSLETKVDKALAAKPTPTPVQAAPAPRPQTVQSVPQTDLPAMGGVADGDISANALRFLQESNTPDLGIDYMSL